jgi:hypothetical protein
VTFPVVFPDPTYGIMADVLGVASMTPASAMIVVSRESADRAERLATGAITVAAPAAGAPVVKGYRGIATAADPDGSLERAFGVDEHPTIVVIDRRGRIARRFETVPSATALQTYLGRLAAQPAPAGLPRARAVEPHLSVFDDPTTAWDGNPPSLFPRHVPCPYVPGSVHLAATGPGGAALLVGQGLGGGILVVSHYASNALGSGVGCGFIRVFRVRPQRVVISGPAGKRRVNLPWVR